MAVYARSCESGFTSRRSGVRPTGRPTRIIDEAIEVVAAASRMGFEWVSIGQHWLSHPTVWPQPLPMLARLAPETGAMRLKTSVLLLPILNPVEVAESVATLDHISHGRLDVGVAIGYRELELGVAGLARADRVPKLEESLELDEARCGAATRSRSRAATSRVEGGRLGFTPYQKPHPPLEMGAQSEGATRRAARLTDGVFFGPQLGWADVARFGAMFREERAPRRRRERRLRGRLAQPDRRRHQGGRGRGGARLSGEDVHDVPHVADAGADHGTPAARLRDEPGRLDDPRLAADCVETIERARAHGAGAHRLHDLQPAGRRARAHRLPADDRRARSWLA